MCLRVGHQHSQFWPILDRFMDYYSPFWGPKAISKVVELQGALTCRSSTITVWTDSGPFLGLLLYFGVSESFPRLTNSGVCLRVGHQHPHIRPILVRFVIPKRFTWLLNTKVCLRVGRQDSRFGSILARFLDYYSPFWGPGAIFTIDNPRVRLHVRHQHS